MKRHQILTFIFIIYIISLLYITLLAWNYGASLGPAGPGGRNYNIIPFRSIYRIGLFSPSMIDPIRILIGNIVLFLPFGFLVPALFSRLRKIIIVMVLGCLTSISIEVSQFVFTHRVANIDDVILNTLGVLIGYVAFSILYSLRKRIIVFMSSSL
ncbi:VanZ family protein [Halalkalibacter sp. APA_J-10(15)]|uniref:VanZ family protein n=1 Tax=unclassified Halalkalibacter TaxID=2893063 RepID=UPI001FF5853A|nr:VanZ family protein [Halalkalibacter sp. APA_J-10(15)]MCK0471899.1 VanZ family protein [Halalkalibacter sp. APA_J-10(15)]